MTYDLNPRVARLTPFNHQNGGALAAVQLLFGPISISTKLYKNDNGYWLSLPSRHSEASDKWYEQVVIGDLGLKYQAQQIAVEAYERASQGEVVAV